ncbi:UTP--glucose-1-phosphate uridylyltransferase [Limnohabitans sp. MMS-10A-160]|uniref:UTP--glucose-1-phosphate uridylyltransferase GalU n=1 Tax=unclassified Limnohabitans TaxID=2626134 RepID=UPI000D3606B6|nr:MULTISPECIES: UTP--glucose-1-phosphate uridylyltransferase GalU [unclassified Limnohabitans]PUE15618.1 UTP--glucose-1-phosphate uridylyltransferase [Limnohabitans sp. MMS-10A-192]PUE23532.1 UTP--glucose-1-phosphate uridylyltransferase [Limnohabitans sp. MMS-10A-160]
MKPIRKAVFPVAGLGTRFLPATKASPKEMLAVVDKPLIQYAVEEAVAAGMTDLIFVTGRHKRAIEDHFDASPELEAELEAKGKLQLLDVVQNILPSNVNCIFVRQPVALGLGHAVLCARPAVGDEPFAVLLADDLMVGPTPITQQLVRTYWETGCSVLAVQDVPREQTRQYGIVAGPVINDRLSQVTEMVEKPNPEQAPSTLAVAGRYVLTPGVFDLLAKGQRGVGGEIQLTDAIEQLTHTEKVFAHRYEGRRYDCGSKLGLLQASVDLAEHHSEVGQAFAAWLKKRQPLRAQDMGRALTA